MTAVLSFVGLGVLLILGHWLRVHVRWLRRLFLPACVIGGLLGLAALETTARLGHPVPAAWTTG